jgi:hypothetical protein
MPSHAAKAYEAVRRSVVRVRGLGHEKEKDGHLVQGVGSGVVIVDTGIILTNLHVVAGADRVQIEFDDGLESEVTMITEIARWPMSGRSTTSPYCRRISSRTTCPRRRCARRPISRRATR